MPNLDLKYNEMHAKQSMHMRLWVWGQGYALLPTLRCNVRLYVNLGLHLLPGIIFIPSMIK